MDRYQHQVWSARDPVGQEDLWFFLLDTCRVSWHNKIYIIRSWIKFKMNRSFLTNVLSFLQNCFSFLLNLTPVILFIWYIIQHLPIERLEMGWNPLLVAILDVDVRRCSWNPSFNSIALWWILWLGHWRTNKDIGLELDILALLLHIDANLGDFYSRLQVFMIINNLYEIELVGYFRIFYSNSWFLLVFCRLFALPNCGFLLGFVLSIHNLSIGQISLIKIRT